MGQQYSKRILLSVTGMSPAVVTETLYGLIVDKKFIPTEIQVITTQFGKNTLLKGLLGIVNGRKEKVGALEEFINDYGEQYGFTDIHFDENCITVIETEDEKGNFQKLDDIRSDEENTLASDQIVSLVGNLCQDDDTELHVSIAGGRKTMGFFLGYALSLFGRKQDSLSHVLVNEDFEKGVNFFYPTPYSYKIYNRDGDILGDAAEAQVTLAEIPWVHLGLGLPEDLKSQKISYTESVERAQALQDEPTIKFLDFSDRIVQFGRYSTRLTPRAYAFLLSLCISKLQGWEYDIFKNIKQVGESYIYIYKKVKGDGKMNEVIETAEKNIKDFDSYKRVFIDSKSDLLKSLREIFSLAKGTKTAYLPSFYKNVYSLLIEPEALDLSDIEEDIKKYL